MFMQKKIFFRDKKLASTCKLIENKKIALLFLSLLLPLGCTSWDSEKSPNAEPAAPAPQALRVGFAQQRDMAQRLSYVGTVHSRQEVKILAQLQGTVRSLAAEGATVGKGKILVQIAAEEVQARQTRVYAESQRALTERDFLCGKAQRDTKLGASGAISKIQVDQSRKACNSADAALRAARASQREVGAAVKKNHERAPFAGRVLRWLVEPGQNVMPGMPLMIFGSHDLEFRLQVAERDIGQGVIVGTQAWLQLGDQTLRLEVAEVAPMATGPGRSVEVKIPFDPDAENPKVNDPKANVPKDDQGTALRSLGHGMSARVDLVLAAHKQVLAVPEQALRQLGDQAWVFVVQGDRVSRRQAQVGIRDQGWVEITGALQAGDQVALSNLDVLQEGMLVYPVLDRAQVQP